MTNAINKMIEIAQNNEWTVTVDESDYTFSKYSPAGQDFNFTVSGDTAQEIIDGVRERYNNFDCSSEAYLWLDSDGHGTNGAPYDMKEVYEDMEACEQMIDELWEALVGECDEEEDDTEE